jgi:hypothetical protein
VVLIHRFDVLGVDLHCHKIFSPNSSYFSLNRRFYLPICAQINEQLAQNFSKKSKPEKAGLRPAKAGPLPVGQRHTRPRSIRSSFRSPTPRARSRLPRRSHRRATPRACTSRTQVLPSRRPLARSARPKQAHLAAARPPRLAPAQRITAACPLHDRSLRSLSLASIRPPSSPGTSLRLRQHGLPTSSSPQRNATSRPAHFCPTAPSY